MRYAAELFGTFVLVMGGIGAAVLGGPQIGTVGAALVLFIASGGPNGVQRSGARAGLKWLRGTFAWAITLCLLLS